jgi:protein phosphatase
VELSERVVRFVDSLVSHYVFDDGKLVVAHAGLRAELQGRASGRVREFCLYGETTGETDEFGFPVRYAWANEYRGSAMVVYGHTPVPDAEWVNGTICIDTGCVFGGRLTALRYPERELVAVTAKRAYYDAVKPLHPPAPPQRDDLLDIADVSGKRIVHTRVAGRVTLREQNTAAALEVMSRFAVAPNWLVYLPPTMSPCETAPSGELLERPEEAFAYFQRNGVPRVICEEKHMGSRAVVTVCRDAEAARRRFGASDRLGVVTTRTGRAFFPDVAIEQALLDRVRSALDRAGFWELFTTDWFCIDAELMPWSAKAQELLREQYAALGSAAGGAFELALPVLALAKARGLADIDALIERTRARQDLVERYVAAYRRYCWPVEGLSGLRLAPFHLLATEGKVHDDRDHAWHMETLAELSRQDDLLLATRTRVVELTDADELRAGARFWHELTESGGEGMVIKPLDWVVRGPRGLVQPAVKCRGPEYLRIIYGPEYTLPENLERLRARGLAAKRALATREYALGLEALHRFVEGEPLHRVHECVFGVLALESEPVDPRL